MTMRIPLSEAQQKALAILTQAVQQADDRLMVYRSAILEGAGITRYRRVMVEDGDLVVEVEEVDDGA